LVLRNLSTVNGLLIVAKGTRVALNK